MLKRNEEMEEVKERGVKRRARDVKREERAKEEDKRSIKSKREGRKACDK